MERNGINYVFMTIKKSRITRTSLKCGGCRSVGSAGQQRGTTFASCLDMVKGKFGDRYSGGWFHGGKYQT